MPNYFADMRFYPDSAKITLFHVKNEICMQYYLLGRKALPAFKAQQLQNELINRLPDTEAVEAHFCYLLQTSIDLSAETKEALCHLLQARIVPIEADLNRFWVWPRRGTLSPWSSKAKDIIARIGLNEVTRLEQGICYQIHQQIPFVLDSTKWSLIADLFYDKLTEECVREASAVNLWFDTPKAVPLTTIRWLSLSPAERLALSNEKGYAFNEATIAAISAEYTRLGRDPTDAELMMIASVNSEHCRHHIFKSHWVIDGVQQSETLFSQIQQTYRHHADDVYSAYCDNGAIIGKRAVESIWPRFSDHHYVRHHEDMAMVIKVETHNHPTAIAPFSGAATGSGGEIRDEGATGRGAKPKAGLTGFNVSNLHIPGLKQEWEQTQNIPGNKASALTIMLQGPIGAASFNNEFGRPNLCGYFRSFEQRVGHTHWGYHKPVMLAGGLGTIRESQFTKEALPVNALIIVLGGPALRIGLGGGALSSQVSAEQNDALDYASVQRANAEMQRRAQEVINSCWSLGRDNPIVSIHDVGAGGLSNAIPELVYDHKRGAQIELRDIPSADLSLSPLELWCNESQERYVLVITENRLAEFSKIAEREHCAFAVVGFVTETPQLIVYDREHQNNVIDMSLPFLLDTQIPFIRQVSRSHSNINAFKHKHIQLEEACLRVLKHPTVANKSFLITIGDRSVGGLTYRDQMVGPWQIPVADVAVSVAGFYQHSGEAMAIGERSPVAILNPAASGRLAVGEAITNMAAAAIENLSDIKLSANWMAACGIEKEDCALWDTVKAVATELCVDLNLTIPVGKDSLSMQTQWQQDGTRHQVVSPLTVAISAFAPVYDVRSSLTPQLQITYDDSVLILIDLGVGQNRLGGSIFSEVYNEMGKGQVPDVDSPTLLQHFFKAIQQLNQNNQILAYHDRSDGGLFVTLVEMAFAAHTGLTIHLDALGPDPIASLFAEELGAVIQVEKAHLSAVLEQLKRHELAHCSHVIGELAINEVISFYHRGQKILEEHRAAWQSVWSEVSYRMQALRDNPLCAEEEFKRIALLNDPGLYSSPSFDFKENILAPYLDFGIKPKVAILREVGVNGQVEMAAAFMQAGFIAVDVHMSDILNQRINLDDFKVLAICGGFSFGDVLGAGRGWSEEILMNARLKETFSRFFNRADTLTLGVCNGCQMLSQLRDIIPGAAGFPHFIANQSQQFEARVVMVEVTNSPAILLKDMVGSRLPIVVSHGEGLAQWTDVTLQEKALTALRYLDHLGHATTRYPFNPNGSAAGATAFSSSDGRVLIMMPHPERCYRSWQCSWRAPEWTEYTPWHRLFANARVWLE